MTAQLPSKERLQEIIDVDARFNPEVRAMALALLAAYEQEPVGFDTLRDAVAEMTGGRPMEWMNGDSKGHQVVPFINFNSLSRIVEKFRTHPAPSIPAAVPTFEEWCASAEQNPVGKDRFIMKLGYEACRSAMLQDSTPGKVKVKAGDPQLPGGIDPTIHQAINDALSTCVREAIRKECLPGGLVYWRTQYECHPRPEHYRLAIKDDLGDAIKHMLDTWPHKFEVHLSKKEG